MIRVTACRILPDGNLIIIDNKHLLLISYDGNFIRKVVTFKQDPYDVCFIRDNTVAVTLGSVKQTKLLDIEKNKVIQTVTLSHQCYGVVSDGETLVISSKVKQSTRVNLNDLSYTILAGMEGVFHMSLFQGNIYGTRPYQNKVICFSSTGETLWTFQLQDIIEMEGITLDMNGFVYVVSQGNNSIVVASLDGKTCKTILSKADGIKSSRRIDINRETGMMIVVSDINNGSIFSHFCTARVYKI
ncbi:unnamed protein product [Mytilus edulis]|uniref:Uncharacterized protein n=1 Tax=Mytilus edulis TaxID=6550 RepID=A0A8S3S5H2_MYTED|nr:unnamed protein product [Mytilus edulis]